ncbi:hypothetical protein OROGR_010059 [Orobanche gracilis]
MVSGYFDRNRRFFGFWNRNRLHRFLRFWNRNRNCLEPMWKILLFATESVEGVQVLRAFG